MQRQPKLPSGGGGGVLLPFAAKQVSVARLELGEALAGRPAALSLDGSFVAGVDGSIAARLDAKRIDGRAGTLTAAIDRANVSAPFAIDIKLSEDADGILVGLMKRGSGPGIRLPPRRRSTATRSTVRCRWPRTARRISPEHSRSRRPAKRAAILSSTATATSPNWCRRNTPTCFPGRSTWPSTPTGRASPTSPCRTFPSARAR